MGACGISGTYRAYDWQSGIRRVQEEAEAYYGHQEGYSGAANSCSFYFKGNKFDVKEKELNKYIDERMDMLGKRDGEVLCLGVEGFDIIKTVIEPCNRNISDVDKKFLFKGIKNPALLLRYNYSRDFYEVVKTGTIAEMKVAAHEQLRKKNYSENYYILTKKSMLSCKGDKKTVKKTTRKNDVKTLVLPIYKFIYYGWAAE